MNATEADMGLKPVAAASVSAQISSVCMTVAALFILTLEHSLSSKPPAWAFCQWQLLW